MRKYLILLFLIFNLYTLSAQEENARITVIKGKIDSLKVEYPSYGETVDISVGRLRLTEMLKTVAEMTGVNLSVRDDFDCIVSCNFTKSSVGDLIVFLCKEYSLDIEVFGNIVSIFRYNQPLAPYLPVDIAISSDSLLTYSFTEKKLSDVAQNITSKTGANIIVPKELRELMVSGNALNVSVADALEIISRENTLDLYSICGEQKLWCFNTMSQSENKPQKKMVSRKIDNVFDEDTTDVVYLYSRAVSKIKETIPDPLLKDVAIIVSDEMNSIVLHGKKDDVERLREYVNRIDTKIPLVNIDVIIIETTHKFLRKMGVRVGRKESALDTKVSLGDGLEVTLGSETMMSLLNRIGGFSNVILGNLPDKIYAELKLLENKGYINFESTPKLATLNGHQAVLSKGDTKYYKEINTSYMGSQNPLQTSSYNWKSVDADLILSITPYVSCDSLITLNIDLSQSEFGNVVEETAPPEIKKRGFKSIVRVSNGEVVLLGGIDSNLVSEDRGGVPGIIRLPVLRWIFGGLVKEYNNTKMNVLIRAQIIE